MSHILIPHRHSDSHIVTFAGHVKNLFDQFFEAVALRVTAIFRRKYLAAFRQMSDQHLSDIGLTRGDIYEAALLGRGQDVTSYFAEIVQKRRHEIKGSGAFRN